MEIKNHHNKHRYKGTFDISGVCLAIDMFSDAIVIRRKGNIFVVSEDGELLLPEFNLNGTAVIERKIVAFDADEKVFVYDCNTETPVLINQFKAPKEEYNKTFGALGLRLFGGNQLEIKSGKIGCKKTPPSTIIVTYNSDRNKGWV